MFRSALLALALCAAPAGAQCINIDFGDAFGSPSPTYGAAAGQAGVWQVLAPVLGQDLALVDTAGSATTATVRFDWGPLASSSLGGSDREPTGEHEKLVDDWWSINSNDYSTLFEVQFKGLEPGLYRVYTYSWWDPGKFKKTKVDVLRGGVFGAYIILLEGQAMVAEHVDCQLMCALLDLHGGQFQDRGFSTRHLAFGQR